MLVPVPEPEPLPAPVVPVDPEEALLPPVVGCAHRQLPTLGLVASVSQAKPGQPAAAEQADAASQNDGVLKVLQ